MKDFPLLFDSGQFIYRLTNQQAKMVPNSVLGGNSGCWSPCPSLEAEFTPWRLHMFHQKPQEFWEEYENGLIKGHYSMMDSF